MDTRHPRYERKESYPLEIIFGLVGFGKQRLDGDVVRMNSERYLAFKTKGTTCVRCGVKGTYFAKERCWGRVKENFHLNLYGLKSDGSEVMMTIDHILPKSRGGKNEISNYQPMCHRCNCVKGNSTEELRAQLGVV